MLLADDRRAPLVNESIVREAWADLQQLPSSQTPNESATQKSGQPTVIEFGGLQNSELNEHVEFEDYSAVVDVAPQRETFSYAVAPRVESRANESASFATTAPVQRRPMHSIEEPQSLTSSLSQRRPRTHDDCVPVAADPFADQFEEEEIVFDQLRQFRKYFIRERRKSTTFAIERSLSERGGACGKV